MALKSTKRTKSENYGLAAVAVGCLHDRDLS